MMLNDVWSVAGDVNVRSNVTAREKKKIYIYT